MLCCIVVCGCVGVVSYVGGCAKCVCCVVLGCAFVTGICVSV